MTKVLSAIQFAKTYKPSEYGDSWSEVPHNEEFKKFTDPDQLSHDEMVKDVATHGIKEPVQVYKGHVVDGHHRAAAAIEANVDIPFQKTKSPMYEGQIEEGRR